jgi:hypothetical protein
VFELVRKAEWLLLLWRGKLTHTLDRSTQIDHSDTAPESWSIKCIFSDVDMFIRFYHMNSTEIILQVRS